jgi:cyclopropane-fatty-acyl-phospholipid synthase
MSEKNRIMRYTQGEKGGTLQHYDMEPDIFKLFLDPYMKYSSGLYLSGDESLAEAQVQKMEFIAEQLGIRDGQHILDVGCGWGSLLLFAAQRFSCKGHGVTPAPKQVEYLHQKASEWGIAHLVHADASHFQDLSLPQKKFNAITFIGSIVHIDDKPGVLQECYRLLKPGGKIYISETCFRNRQKYKEFSNRPGTSFVREEVFGWGSLVPFSEILSALEDANFSLTALADLTAHYHRTIEDWMRNIRVSYERLEATRPGVAKKLLQLFEIANAGWGFTTKHYAVVASKKR